MGTHKEHWHNNSIKGFLDFFEKEMHFKQGLKRELIGACYS